MMIDTRASFYRLNAIAMTLRLGDLSRFLRLKSCPCRTANSRYLRTPAVFVMVLLWRQQLQQSKTLKTVDDTSFGFGGQGGLGIFETEQLVFQR
jgi:hypothetical protein